MNDACKRSGPGNREKRESALIFRLSTNHDKTDKMRPSTVSLAITQWYEEKATTNVDYAKEENADSCMRGRKARKALRSACACLLFAAVE